MSRWKFCAWIIQDFLLYFFNLHLDSFITFLRFVGRLIDFFFSKYTARARGTKTYLFLFTGRLSGIPKTVGGQEIDNREQFIERSSIYCQRAGPVRHVGFRRKWVVFFFFFLNVYQTKSNDLLTSLWKISISLRNMLESDAILGKFQMHTGQIFSKKLNIGILIISALWLYNLRTLFKVSACSGNEFIEKKKPFKRHNLRYIFGIFLISKSI